MTTTASPISNRISPARIGWLQRIRSIGRMDAGLISVTLLAAVLYLWNLTVSGYANTYYAMAAQAASQDWGAFFFGSLDSANFITLDKPPASVWLMGLSVRLFGLSSWSVLLPQALLGIATVGVLYLAVRRPFGRPAATLAAIVMALTPAAMLIFRYDNPDALLTFVLVVAAWALGRGLERGSLRWPLLAAALVGTGFLTKFLQAYLVIPAFALVWLVAAPVSLRRRLAGLAAASLAVIVTSGWWVAIVEWIPAASRPYIGGSTGNSVIDLIFGYDGLGRIFGQGAGSPGGGTGVMPTGGIGLPGGAPGGLPAGLPGVAAGLPGGLGAAGAGPGAGPGAGFGGTSGIFRMFNTQFGGEVSWLIPLALLSLAVGIVIYRRTGRTDRRRAAYLLWGSWLAVHVLVFSFMSGIAHPYYSVMLAPAIGALVGAGVSDLWRIGKREVVARLVLAIGLIGTAVWGLILLDRVPTFLPGLGLAAVIITSVAGVFLVVSPARLGRNIRLAALTIALAGALVGSAAFSGATMTRAIAGGDPSAGPVSAFSGPGADGLGSGGPGPSGLGGNGAPGASGGVGMPGGPAAQVDSAVIEFLVANQGDATWIVAAQGAATAADIQLEAGKPVLTMGGFSGSDAAPTTDELKVLVSAGQVRFVLASGSEGRGGPPGNNQVTEWVTGSCSPVSLSATGVTALYDCAGAA